MTYLANWISRSNRNTFLLLLAITIIARFITFFRLTIDYDETTYAVMADHILQGAVLYKDVIDIKQPGIFLIFGLIQLLFGKSVILIRLVAALAVAGGAYFLYLTKRRLDFNFKSSILSAVVFVLMFNFYFGFATNTEVFFIFCTCLAIYLFFSHSRWWTFLLCGVTFGVGFTIKQHIAFDFTALGIFFFGWSIYQRKLKKNFMPMALMVMGFLIPPSSVHLIYWATGYYDYYHFISYIAPRNYSSQKDWARIGIFMCKGVLVYLPFILAAQAGLRSPQWTRQTGWFITLFTILAIVAVVITGQTHQHYYLQLVYPISFAVGEIAALQWVKTLFQRKYTLKVVVALGIIYCLFLTNFYYNRYIVRPNKASDLVDFLEDKISDDATLYTGDAPQYLYWHFDKISPTPYVHSTVLTKESNLRTLDIDLDKELNSIYASQPDIVILSEGYPYGWFKGKVVKNYQLMGNVHEFSVYQR
ncbi:MAG: glycosyltransferase family 39 protein [Cyclobacteriaceae bacterium]